MKAMGAEVSDLYENLNIDSQEIEDAVNEECESPSLSCEYSYSRQES